MDSLLQNIIANSTAELSHVTCADCMTRLTWDELGYGHECEE